MITVFASPGAKRQSAFKIVVFSAVVLMILIACKIPDLNQEPSIVPMEKEANTIEVLQGDDFRFVGTGTIAEDFDFNSDFSKIAYIGVFQRMVSPPFEVAIVDLQSGSLEIVSANRDQWGQYSHPRWHPQSNLVLYSTLWPEDFAGQRTGYLNLVTMERVGLEHGTEGEWSSSGHSIYVKEGRQILKYNIGETTWEDVVELPSEQFQFIVSPRTDRLAIYLEGSNKIMIIDSRKLTEVSNIQLPEWRGVTLQDWSPDEQWVVLATGGVDAEMQKWIYQHVAYHVESGCLTPPTVLTLAHSDETLYLPSFAWAADGQEIAVAGQYNAKNGIYLLPIDSEVVEKWLASLDCTN